MRNIGLTTLAFVSLLAASGTVPATVAAKAGSSTSFRAGAYRGKEGSEGIVLTVKRARCGGKTQLCVTLTKGPTSLSCEGTAAQGGGPFGPLTGSVALSSSGKISQYTAVSEKTYPEAGLRETKRTGYKATFTKKGTVSGTLEIDVAQIEGGVTAQCPGREKFTAKLG